MGAGAKPPEFFRNDAFFSLREISFLIKRGHCRKAIFVDLLKRAEF